MHLFIDSSWFNKNRPDHILKRKKKHFVAELLIAHKHTMIVSSKRVPNVPLGGLCVLVLQLGTKYRYICA